MRHIKNFIPLLGLKYFDPFDDSYDYSPFYCMVCLFYQSGWFLLFLGFLMSIFGIGGHHHHHCNC